MTSRKEIDLVINAMVKGQKNLQAIPKVISDLEEALDRQTSAAKRGESSIDELKATMLSLQDVRSVLASSGGLIGDFKKLSTQIEQSEAAVSKTAKEYDEYKAKIGDISKATDAQATKLQRLAARQDRAVATLDRQRQQYADMGVALREAGIATDNLAESELAALQAAAQLGVVINKNQQAIAGYANDVRTARDATKQLEDASKVSAQRLDQFLRQKATEASEQSRALAELKADIIARSASSARDMGLQKTADDAERAARGFTTLARASKDLSPRVTSVRDALAAIIDPTKNATATLGGIEAEIKTLGDSIGGINGPVKDYQQSMAALKRAQDSLVGNAKLLDNFNRQTVALRASRAEFVSARSEVTQYAAKVREGGEAGAAFTQALASAQARLKTATDALNQQLNVTRQARTALQGAGMSTRDLAGEQGRLNSAARASTGAMQQLGEAVKKYGQANDEAGKKRLFGQDGERTTLNFMQRLRGQVLSLTAAYVGLFQVINTAKGALDAMIGMEAIESRLAVATESNDPKVIGKEYEYLRGRADYYGVGVQKLAESYGAYAIAAKSANFTNDQSKYTFEQLTGGMRVLKMNTDQQGRAWTQLQQILSKTKPEMEDIKTIAESGFVGVQGMMARGLLSVGTAGIRAGSEVSDMFELMKKGALDSGQAIYALAVQAEKELGMRVPQAIKTLQAEQGRFETSTFEFKKAIAESGWADAYTAVLVKLRELMSGDEGAAAAKAIGSAFKLLADILIGVLENLETVKTVSLAIGAIWSVKMLGAGLDQLRKFKAEAGGTATAMGTLQKAFLVFQAAVVGFAIGTWARENFQAVRVYGIYLVTSLEMAWATIKHSFMAAFEVLPGFFGNILRGLVNTLTKSVRVMGTVLAGLAKAVGMDGVADALNKGVAAMTLSYNNTDRIISNRKAQLQRDLDAIKRIRSDMLDDEYGGVPKSVSPTTSTVVDPTAAPGVPRSRLKDADGKGAAAAKKRLSDIQEIENALDSLSAKIDKKQDESLDAQVRAALAPFDALAKKIAALGGKEGAEFGKRLAAAKTAMEMEVVKDFNEKMLSEQQALQKKLEEAEIASGRRSTSNLEARLKAVKDRYAQTYRDIEAYGAKRNDPQGAAAMKERLDGEVATLQNMERQKFAYDELKRYETDLNNLLQARSAQIKTVNDLKEGSLISEEERHLRTQAILTQMQPQIVALADEAQRFAASLGAGFDPARMQQFIANLQLGVTSMARFKKEVLITENAVNERLATGLTNTFDTAIKGLAEAAAGQKSWSEAIKGTARAFLQFAADFLREIAMMIAKRLILKALEGTGIGAFFSGLTQMHSGGVVGQASGQAKNARVSAGWFANAPRYHSGGVMGLRSDEYPTILQRGEEVLAADSPRNIMNGGAGLGGGQQQASPQGMRFVFVDDRSKVAEAMASAEGDRVIVEAIRRNAASVRSYVR